MNFGQSGTSEDMHGAKFKVGVLLAASSASKLRGLFSKSSDGGGCCCDVVGSWVSLLTLLVEDGGDGMVAVTKVVICLFGAKVMVADFKKN